MKASLPSNLHSLATQLLVKGLLRCQCGVTLTGADEQVDTFSVDWGHYRQPMAGKGITTTHFPCRCTFYWRPEFKRPVLL